MRTLAIAAVCAWCTIGVGLEVAHPVFFASQPIVAFTPIDAPAPTLMWAGESYQAVWRATESDGRTRWEGALEDGAPLGPWTVCLNDGPCRTVLRVDDERAVLLVQGPPGTEIGAGVEDAVLGERGETFFVLPPGDHTVNVKLPGVPAPAQQPVQLEAGAYRLLRLGAAELTASTNSVLPGYPLTIDARVEAPEGVRIPNLELKVPEGWTAERDLEFLEPEGRWKVLPPEDFLGEATLSLRVPGLELEAYTTILVEDRLPIDVVTAHWDIWENKVDFTTPGEITYDRLRWAVSLRGQEMPYTGLTVTQGHLDALAQRWQEE